MARFRGLLLIFGMFTALVWVKLPTSSQAQTNSLRSTPPLLPNGRGSDASSLIGTVKTADGKPLEGVAISAKAQGKTITTSVYTNQAGEYLFPGLDNGQYRIWAQAVGFEMAQAKQAISSGKKIQQYFTLKPVRDFENQLSDAEWFESLPDDTPEDRRMRKVILYNCGTCHEPGFVLEKRFDAAGWELILNYMIKEASSSIDIPGGGNPELDEKGQPIGPARRLLEFYKKDLIAYLSRVRGAKPSPLRLKPFPRPTGEAAAIVVTEYDLPRGDAWDSDYRNGSDWSKGIRSSDQTRVTHDVMVGNDGNIYFTDNRIPGRTVGKLDPRTGRVTSYSSSGADGTATPTQGGTMDQKGNVWLENGRLLIKFDPRTEKFQRFPKPSSIPGFDVGIAVDSKGKVWGSQGNGAARLNTESGEYTEFNTITKVARPYGMTVDSEDKAWFPLIAVDKVGVVDGRTGEISEVVLPPLDEEISAKDREIGERSGAWTANAPLYQKGPRRLGADPKGDTVWVAEYWAGRLAKIDIHTRKITEYKVPYRYSYPYKAAVDKNHMVWFAMANADRFGKFNPFTEQFTMYQLPTRGTNARHIAVDNSTDVPTIWIPYWGAGKIARVQFRGSAAR